MGTPVRPRRGEAELLLKRFEALLDQGVTVERDDGVQDVAQHPEQGGSIKPLLPSRESLISSLRTLLVVARVAGGDT
jgi:hypothetical protein